MQVLASDRPTAGADWLEANFVAHCAQRGDQTALRRAEEFAAPRNAHRRYLMGRNEHSLALSETLDIAGFVDDFAAGEWNGKPVVATAELPRDALVAHCIFSQRPHSAWNRLSAAQPSVLTYADLLRVGAAPVPNFVADMRNDLARNTAQWRWLRAALADEVSQQVLDDLTRYRLTGDLTHTARYSWRVAEQYLDPVASLTPNAVIVDCGGFDGDTAEAFCAQWPNYRRLYLFEPSPANMARAKQRLCAQRDIVFDQRGVSKALGSVRFDSNGGSASAPSSSGAIEVEMTTIDNAVGETANFIKMDLEGGEYDALHGGARQIERNAPVLALAVYHSACDFWRLAAFARELRSDYRLYLRHYTEGWAETVAYLVAT